MYAFTCFLFILPVKLTSDLGPTLTDMLAAFYKFIYYTHTHICTHTFTRYGNEKDNGKLLAENTDAPFEGWKAANERQQPVGSL